MLISRFVSSDDPEKLLLVVLGLTILVAGVAQQLQVSAAVGAFLVGIALSGEVAEGAHTLLTPLAGPLRRRLLRLLRTAHRPGQHPARSAARARAGTGHRRHEDRDRLLGGPAGRDLRKGRWRAGGTLVARGEFSIVIAGLAVSAGIEPSLGPLATAYVLILVVLGPLTARFTEPLARRLSHRLPRRPAPRPANDAPLDDPSPADAAAPR